MDVKKLARREGSTSMRRVNAPTIMFKKSLAQSTNSYATASNGVQFSKRKVIYPMFNKKVNYSEVTKLAKPNAFTPSFRRGDNENVQITSYKLLRKDCSSCSKTE